MTMKQMMQVAHKNHYLHLHNRQTRGLYHQSIRGVSKGAELEEEEREAEEEQEEKEVEREKISHKRGITMKQTKYGKMVFIFSDEQKDMAKVMADKLHTKCEQTKQTELCDFKVMTKQRKKHQ